MLGTSPIKQGVPYDHRRHHAPRDAPHHAERDVYGGPFARLAATFRTASEFPENP